MGLVEMDWAWSSDMNGQWSLNDIKAAAAVETARAARRSAWALEAIHRLAFAAARALRALLRRWSRAALATRACSWMTSLGTDGLHEAKKAAQP